MGFLIWLGVFAGYFLVEFVINLFFTYKIKHVAQEEYTKAAFAGSISTFLFIFSTLIAAVIGVSLIGSGHENDLFSNTFFDSKILFMLWTTFALAVGNFCATISIPFIESKLFKGKKEEK